MSVRQQEARYAARTIRAFLNGTAAKWDWDDFTSCPLRDSAVNDLRLKALNIDLPVDAAGELILRSLAGMADRFASANGGSPPITEISTP